MSPVALPDWLPDLKSWLKAHPDLTPLIAGRVFFRIPDKVSGYPLMRIYRSGGGVEVTGDDSPLMQVRAGLEVWGNDDRIYEKVRQAATAVESAVAQIEPGRLVAGGQTYCGGGWVTASIDSPDPDDGWPRYVLDALFTIRLVGSGDS